MTKDEFKQEALQRWATAYNAHMSLVAAVALLSDKAAQLFDEVTRCNLCKASVEAQVIRVQLGLAESASMVCTYCNGTGSRLR